MILTLAGWDSLHNRHREEGCGTSVAGLQLCISPGPQAAGATLEVKNTGPDDAVLNLGILLGNGSRQYPTAIRLLLTDGKGRQHYAELAVPGIIGGRVDPFVLPLPSAASLTLPLRISNYIDSSGQVENWGTGPQKSFMVQAQFTGKGVSQAEANRDMKGIALMRYWTGTVVSNTVKIGKE